ncbi:MAG: GlpM family protein [Campylobacterota bacterium]|nr:GlpM family protein [Campylobacterota bacterium]
MIYIKSFLGAAIVWLLMAISKSKNYFIAGLVPLFPTFGLIAHFIVFYEQGTNELRETVLFGIFSLIPYLVYLVLMFIFIEKLGIKRSMVISIIGWCLVALILIKLW